MPKQQILDAISQALDAIGIDSLYGGDEYGESEMVEENRVPIWSELAVDVADTQRGPIHDRASAFGGVKKMTEPQQRDQYGMPYDDDSSEMMVAMGMV